MAQNRQSEQTQEQEKLLENLRDIRSDHESDMSSSDEKDVSETRASRNVSLSKLPKKGVIKEGQTHRETRATSLYNEEEERKRRGTRAGILNYINDSLRDGSGVVKNNTSRAYTYLRRYAPFLPHGNLSLPIVPGAGMLAAGLATYWYNHKTVTNVDGARIVDAKANYIHSRHLALMASGWLVYESLKGYTDKGTYNRIVLNEFTKAAVNPAIIARNIAPLVSTIMRDALGTRLAGFDTGAFSSIFVGKTLSIVVKRFMDQKQDESYAQVLGKIAPDLLNAVFISTIKYMVQPYLGRNILVQIGGECALDLFSGLTKNVMHKIFRDKDFELSGAGMVSGVLNTALYSTTDYFLPNTYSDPVKEFFRVGVKNTVIESITKASEDAMTVGRNMKLEICKKHIHKSKKTFMGKAFFSSADAVVTR